MSNGDATPVRRRPPRLLLAALTLLVLGRIPATATVVVPVSMETLAAGSPLVVLGRVEEVSAVADQTGRIFTLVQIVVGQVLKGHLDASSLTLKEEGGAVGGMKEVVFGTPVYRAGEEVLLFLSSRSDGSLRTAHLALGKFRVTFDRAGMPQVERPVPADMEFLGTAAPPADVRPLGDLLALLQSADADPTTGAGAVFIQPQPLEATDPSLVREFVAPYQLVGERFFEPDEGVPLGFLIDSRGDALLGLIAAREASDAALGAWTGVETATITLTDTGLTDDLSGPCPGPHVVYFNDPQGSIPPPSECHGTLAVGGYCSYGSETKRFAGRTFDRALRARVVFADGWDSCAVWNEVNFAEIAAHEMGHALGLGHSSELEPEPNEALRDATMYFRAHFDDRGATLRSDDMNAVSALYPTALPLTITTPDPLPSGLVGAPYDVELHVAHASGPVSWTLINGNDPGLSVTSDGHITGSPTSLGSRFLQVKATDADANSHTKLFHLTVPGVAPTPTPSRSPTRTATGTASPTGTRTATATRTPTPTRTGSATPSATNTAPPTATSSPTATASPTPSVTSTATATASASGTASSSPTSTITPTPEPTESATMTVTVTETASVTDTPGVTATPTASVTATVTTTPSSTATVTATDVPSPTPTVTPTASATALLTASPPTPGPCAGGCAAADPVTVHDLVTLTAVALADSTVERCTAGDVDHDSLITVADTVRGADLALGRCTR